MADATPPPPPKDPSVTSFQAVPAWAAELSKSFKENLHAIRVDVHLISNDLRLVKDRLQIAEERISQQDVDGRSRSDRVRSESEVNLKQSAAIASLIEKGDKLERSLAEVHRKTDAQTAILVRLESVAANPIVRKIAYAVAGAFLAYAIQRGWIHP